MKKAIVLGASGLIGGHVLKLLLADDRYQQIVVIGRRELPISSDKLKQVTGDMFNMETFGAELQDGDDLFIAIGTTKAKTPDKKTYEAIDLGIPVAAAQIAAGGNVKNVIVVSSMGANPTSSIFYTALKGKMEELITKLGFENLVIVRPSLLLGNRDERRMGERLGALFMTTLDFIIPDKHKAIRGESVAKAMITLANRSHTKDIWMNNELHQLAKEFDQ